MPRKTKPTAKRGPHRPAVKTPRVERPKAQASRPATLRTQIRGGRPPRIPGRIGGR